MALRGILPIDRGTLGSDVLAGVTLAALAIPEVMGYTRIAGMPVVTGLYTLLLPALLFAFLGSSRHLVVGADSATAAIMTATLAPLAVPASAQWVQLAGVLAMYCAVLLLVARLARLSFLADFLSRTVLVGFLTGVGVQVALGELPGILGLDAQGSDVLHKLWNALQHLAQVNPADTLVGVAVFVLIVGVRRFDRRFPAALLAVAGAILASWALDLQGRGVAIVGAVQGGLPGLQWPDFAEAQAHIDKLAPAAVAMAMVILAQSAATARAYAAKYNENFSVDADLTGLAAANIGAAVTGAFVVNGSPTKTQMVDSAGGRSQLAHVTMAIVVLLTLLLLTGTIAYLPRAALAAIVFLIGLDLVHGKDLRTIHASRRQEFWIAIVTAAAVVVFGVEPAIIFAMALSLMEHVRRGYRPRNSVVARGDDGHAQLLPVTEPQQYEPGLLVYRFNHAMYYANADVLSQEVMRLVADAAPGLRWFVIDLDPVEDIDFSAGAALLALRDNLKARGVALQFLRASAAVAEQLRRYGIASPQGGTPQFFTSVRDMRHHYEALADA